jgi:ribonuclease HI
MAPLATFLQWNSRSIVPKKPDLIQLINDHSVSVAAISETWLSPGALFRIPGFSCLRDDRDDGRAGCALLIKRCFPFSQISLPPHTRDINAIAAKVMGINFISIYIPHPHINLIPDLSTILFAVSPPLIVLGDFNCHHSSWGSYHSDTFSSFLIDLFDDINVCVINDGTPTHRVYPGQNPHSVPDLSACSPSLSALLTWEVLRQSFGSDHFPIVISKPSSVTPLPKPEPLLKHKLHSADWPSFSLYVDSKIKECLDLESYPEKIEKFKGILLEAADKSIPRKRTAKDQIPSPPWWSAECTAAVKERDDAETTFNESGNLEDFVSFKKTSARTKRFLAKAKKRGWKGFCESLSPRTPPSVIWRNIKKFRGSFKQDTSPPADPSVWLTNFIDRLAPPTVPEEACISAAPFPLTSNPLGEPFSFAELSLVLDGLRDSTPGEDGIPYCFLSKLNASSQGHLLDILNHVFDTGAVPDEWKTQIIIPILKPSKDPEDASSYRPIALSATMGKILEHLVKNRLEWFVENRGILADSQFGFRKGRSTMDSVSILTTDVRLAFSKNEHLLGCFLDISAAYDNVLLPVLRAKMLHLSIPVKIVNIVARLFMGRCIKVRSGSTYSSPRTLWQGLPQGSVLSPLLYNIYTHDLEQSVSSFCNVLQYADDLVLYTSEQSIDKAANNINSALSYLKHWLDEHGLTLSPSKSCTVTFTRKRSIPRSNVLYGREIIPSRESVKFLGVILDGRMSGVSHLNYIIGKCEKGINILRALSGVWWGAHPYCQKLLYNATIRSQMDYGSLILEPCNKGILNKLDLVQAKCLRIILGAMKSSPKNAMQIECVEPPLSLRRQYLADRFVIRASACSGHLLIPRLRSLALEIAENKYWDHKEFPKIIISFSKLNNVNTILYRSQHNPLFECSFKAITYSPKVILDFGIFKDDPGANHKFSKLLEKWPEYLPVFTDSSKMDPAKCVGAAVWIPKYNIVLSLKCPAQSSIFTGESVAILEAVSYLESHHITKAIIFTDSRSCLQALASNQFKAQNKSPLILGIKDKLHKCETQGLDIVLGWIPSHCGISGNECADTWAKQAIETGTQLHNKVYSSDLLTCAQTSLSESWQNMWDASRQHTGRYYGGIEPFIRCKPWFHKFRSAPKWATSTICRLRLGHNCTPVFLAKIRVRDNSLCECGLDEGSLDHIFFNCPRFSYSMYDVLPKKIPRPINFYSLLCSMDSPITAILLKYIQVHNIRL